MVRYLVSYITYTSQVRPCVVEMPEDYVPGQDDVMGEYPFPKLRKAVAIKIGDPTITDFDILSITKLSTTSDIDDLDKRILDAIRTLELDASVSDVKPYLPDFALQMDNESFLNAVVTAVNMQ